MLYINLIKNKVLSLILVLILGFMFIGSTFENVDASAGSNNKTLVLENLVTNGGFDINASGWSGNGLSWDTGTLLIQDTSSEVLYQAGMSLLLDHFYYITIDYDINNPFYQSRVYNGLAYENMDTTIDSDRNISYVFEVLLSHSSLNIYHSQNSGVDLDMNLDNIMLIDLTAHFGSGNEPTQSEMDAILADAPDYFEEWNYNYYEEDATIIETACQRTAVNLIDNGDFSDVSIPWTITVAGTRSIINNYLNIELDVANTVGTIYYDPIIEENHIYYQSLDVEGDINSTRLEFYIGNGYLIVDNDIDVGWNNYGIIWTAFNDNRPYVKQSSNISRNWVANYDNIMLFDLTEMYGQGNEPTYEEFNAIMSTEGVIYEETFSYDDTCYSTVEQNSPFYMYNDYDNGFKGLLDITMTDTIKDLPITSPKITIEKYDLNMNYIGNIYEGYITDYNDDNADGYMDHTFSYELPDPVTTEDGYIYIAYDETDNNILASGYLYKDAGVEFKNENGYNFIATNDSYYGELQESIQYDGDYASYMFNDNNFLINHFSNDVAEVGDTYIKYYSETTDQTEIRNAEDPYNSFCDMSYQGTILINYECYFYSASGTLMPPLINYLNSSSIAHNSYLGEVVSEYQGNYTNFLYSAVYVDNKGVYTYNLENGLGTFIGQAPIFYFDSFNTFSLVSHSVKEGGVLRSNITKPYGYLDDAYDYQYLFDNNTSVYYFNIDGSQEQDIYLEVFFGLTPDDATVTYNLRKIGAYNNGAANDSYNTYISDDYVMRAIIPFTEKVDNGLDVIGMGDTAGKIIIAAIVMIFVTILIYFITRSPLITLLADFLAFALLMVLGIVPTWIMLFILVILVVSIFLKRKGD